MQQCKRAQPETTWQTPRHKSKPAYGPFSSGRSVTCARGWSPRWGSAQPARPQAPQTSARPAGCGRSRRRSPPPTSRENASEAQCSAASRARQHQHRASLAGAPRASGCGAGVGGGCADLKDVVVPVPAPARESVRVADVLRHQHLPTPPRLMRNCGEQDGTKEGRGWRAGTCLPQP